MTDRLTTLMHDEVAGLELPAPPTALIIADGRALRRRRTTGLVAGAVAVVLAAGAVTVASLRGSDRDSVQPADRTAYLDQGAWAVGDEVHVGNHVVDVPGASTLAYSSLGAVVGTDGGDFVLVTAPATSNRSSSTSPTVVSGFRRSRRTRRLRTSPTSVPSTTPAESSSSETSGHTRTPPPASPPRPMAR